LGGTCSCPGGGAAAKHRYNFQLNERK
jgi:hypothetical protein